MQVLNRFSNAKDKVKLKILVLFIAIVTGSCSSSNEHLQIVKDGNSEYSIIIPANPSKEELRAAEFLVNHIEAISESKIPVIEADSIINKCISISKSENIKSGDAFKINTDGENIFIKGGKNKGCVYAVSKILDKHLGVKYYSPDYVVIPKNSNLSIPRINITDSSLNTYRNVHGRFSENEDYKDFHCLHHINDMFAENYYVHTFHKLMPWQKYFQKHPEYYAYMNGKRRIDQLCLSNEDVLKIVLEKLRKEMDLQPEKKVWSVSQDDNFSYCQCEKCKKTIEEERSPSGPIIRFVNKVAKKYPDKIISTLAYQYSRKAPTLTKPLPNVQIMLCTIELNRSKPIATDPGSATFLKDIEDWGKISNHIYLWDYTVDFAHSYCPFPNLHVLQPNIQLFVKNNVYEHFQQTNTSVGHEFSELKSYILAKLLWNPDVNVDSIIIDFTDGFYGPAGESIKKYLYHLQDEITKTGEWLDIYGPPTNYKNTFLSAENIAKYNEYFDEAESKVADIPAYLLHVKTARMSLQYAIMEIGKSDMFGTRGWYKEKNGEYIPVEEMIECLESFHKTAKEAKCKYVNESALSTEEYYQSTKRFIDVQVKGNKAFRKPVSASPKPENKYSDGDLSLLTNGVCGANDYKVHWLGWHAKDFSLILDLQEVTKASTIEISTLWDPKSWILHPKSVSCSVSKDGSSYRFIGKQEVTGNQQKDEVNKLYKYNTPNEEFRFVKFDIKGTIHLYDWHPSAGGESWVFVDEIVVK